MFRYVAMAPQLAIGLRWIVMPMGLPSSPIEEIPAFLARRVAATADGPRRYRR
jgi:hypothetical protein